MPASFLPVFAVLAPFFAVPLLLACRRSPNLREFWSLAAAGAAFVLVLLTARAMGEGTIRVTLCAIAPGLSLQFSVDRFGMLFALVASSLWIVTTIYSIGYMRGLKEHAQTRYFTCFAVAISATLGVAFSGNLLTLYLFYELLSLSTYPLVTHHQDREARTGGRKYLTYLLGTSIGLALPAMIVTFQLAGTLEFTAAGVFPQGTPVAVLGLLLVMFIYGFNKAGVMPLHAWLPGAMVAPTPVSALLHAVAVVKVGVFSVVRVLTGIFGADLLIATSLNTLVCIIAAVTVLTASLIALSQDNLKRRLAFSTIGQLSYIILGVGLASQMGIKGGMLHIAMHAFGKITLFFCAGAIFVATGKKNISEMAGLGRQMPWTFAAFFVGSLSVIGLPPAGGLISKLYMLFGALDAGMQWVVAVYLVSSFLNAAYFLPVVYQAFFSGDNAAAPKVKIREAPLFCLVPPLVTAFFSVILFFYPEIFLRFAALG